MTECLAFLISKLPRVRLFPANLVDGGGKLLLAHFPGRVATREKDIFARDGGCAFSFGPKQYFPIFPNAFRDAQQKHL